MHRRSKPYRPTPDDLEAVAGSYRSDEIGTVITIEAKGDGLAMRLEHSSERGLDFLPIERDAWQLSRIIVRFRRDKAGKVVALDFTNRAVADVRFTRLSGGLNTSAATQVDRKPRILDLPRLP